MAAMKSLGGSNPVLKVFFFFMLIVLFQFGCATPVKIESIPTGASIYSGLDYPWYNNDYCSKYQTNEKGSWKYPGMNMGKAPLSIKVNGGFVAAWWGDGECKYAIVDKEVLDKGYVRLVKEGRPVDREKVEETPKNIVTKIRSIPPGATILSSTDGKYFVETGMLTPFESSERANIDDVNKVYYKLHLDGFKPSPVYSFSYFERGRNINHAFEKITYGYIKLTSNENAVDIYIDNVLAGQIHEDRPFTKKVETGGHQITAKKDFFIPKAINVPLEEKDVFTYYFELVRAEGWREEKPGEVQVEQAVGNLTVVTERNDLVVYIDGTKKIPPFELKDVAAGIYDLRVDGPGVKDRFKITVNNGQTVFVDLDEKN